MAYSIIDFAFPGLREVGTHDETHDFCFRLAVWQCSVRRPKKVIGARSLAPLQAILKSTSVALRS